MRDDAIEIRVETCGVKDLKGCPSCGQHMCKEGSKYVRYRFIEKGNDGHPQDPNLEPDEYHIFTLRVVETARSR